MSGSPVRGVRRRLLSVARGDAPESEQAPASRQNSAGAADLGGDLTAAELLVWLESLRRGGLASVYWNAGKVSLDRAVMRAARLHEDSLVSLCGQKVLVVEILHRRTPATAGSDDALAD